MKNNTIDARLLSSKVALENAGRNKVKSVLNIFGYDEAKIAEGLALYEDAAAKQELQKKEYGEQYAATDAMNEVMSEAQRTYMKHVKIARIALKDQRGAWQALDIQGRRKKTYSGWIKQARVFYNNALSTEAIKTTLANYGITEEILNDSLSKVANTETLMAEQLKEKGEAQVATQIRDEAFEKLEDWMVDFYAISRIAFEDQPQHLEMLGILESS